MVAVLPLHRRVADARVRTLPDDVPRWVDAVVKLIVGKDGSHLRILLKSVALLISQVRTQHSPMAFRERIRQ